MNVNVLATVACPLEGSPSSSLPAQELDNNRGTLYLNQA